MTLSPDDVQSRLTLIGHLYKETLKGATDALRMTQHPPLTPEEKEILFGEVERAVWAMDDALFRDAPAAPEGWLSRVEEEPALREALSQGVSRVLNARRLEAQRGP